MAEVTAFRSNALPYPCYGVPWAVVYGIMDADGDLVTGATTPDAERSLNGDTFADCTNESVEIATASGVYYLLLTAAEMTADIVTVIAKCATAGAKTTLLTLYPCKLVSLRAATAQGGAAGSITLDISANTADDFYNGCLVVGVLDSATEARIITDYTGSTRVANVTPNWNTTPDSDDTFTIYLPEGRQIQQANVTSWNNSVVASPHTNGCPVVTIKDGTGTGEINTNAGAVAVVDLVTTLTTYTGNTVQTGDSFARIGATGSGLTTLATQASVNTIDDFLDTEVAAILAAVDTEIAAIIATLGVAGAGLTALPWNAAWDAEVESEATDALNAYDPPTNAEMDARTIAAAAYATAANLATIAGYLDTEIAAILADTNELQTDWANGGRLDLILDAAGSAGDPWVTALPGAYGAGTAGKIIGDNVNATVSSRATAAALDTVDNFLDTEIADIQGRLPAALVSGRIDASIGAAAANTLTASALAADAVTEIQSGLSTLTAAQVNTEVVDVLTVDTFGEASAVPAATSTLKDKLNWLFALARNKLTQSATTQTVYADDASTPVATSTVSDNGTTASRGEFS